MTERLAIARMGHRGAGVADTEQGPLFVPYTLPGESVTVEPVAGHPERRRLLRVEAESSERVAPPCPHFGLCGGCAVQHWRFTRYREWKRALVADALAQASLDALVDDLVDAHGAGRRRMVLHARRGARGVLQVGFAAARARDIVAIDRCPILETGLARGIEVAWRLAEALRPMRKPLDLHFTATREGLDVDLRGSGPLAPAQQAVLAELAMTLQLARLTRHGDLVLQREAPTLDVGRARVALPPAAFLQATAAGEATLARYVLAHAGAAKNIADLFCGIGPFALRLAEGAAVTAIDHDAKAIAALQRAAQTTSGLKPITALARDLFRRPLLASELIAFEAAVINPPRQGAEAQTRALAEARIPVIVVVSCNAATLARDLRVLVAGGYRVTAVTPIDQFRYSAHVEVVAVLRR